MNAHTDTAIIKQNRVIRQYARKQHLKPDAAAMEWVTSGLAKQYREAIDAGRKLH